MSKQLVIVESPTKAKTISKFLGPSFIVESSFGHVRDLPKSKMGVDIEGGTFEPTYRVPKEKTAQVKKLKSLAAKADSIIFATDEDREGEAISWHLAELLGIDPDKAKRMVFHEITKHAIEEALAHPRSLDMKLVDAQQARRVLDRLVGYELSPFLWKKVARGLSAGRVQSVAVRMIVERERERNAFITEEYWTLDGIFLPKKDNDGQHISASLHSINGKKIDKLALKSKEQIDTILAELKDASYRVTDIDKKQTKRNPPPPFRTSTLQQQANQRFGYSSKQTMRLAQQLYEGIELGSDQVGLITYMRTDSTNLSEKFSAESKTFINTAFGEKYALDKPRVYAKQSKGAQEAHEAIRPTDPSRTPESIKEYLDGQQYKLYELVWRRAVATQMEQALLDKTTIDIDDASKKYQFRANGQGIAFDGWLRLYPELVKEEMLPDVEKDDDLKCVELKPEQHFTKPPARYSDATLIKALEQYGIGRPSTYSPTIATIEARNYVIRDDDKRFQPNDVAMIVTDLLTEHFADIVDYNFTAQMEDNLDAIAAGEKDWKPIISTFYHPFHENIVKKTDEITREEVSQARELGTDPVTGKPVSARIGRYGPFVQLGSKEDEDKPRFASLQEGQLIQTITIEEALVLLSLPKILGQEENENDISVDIGRFGPYVKVGKEYFSLKGTTYNPYTISLQEARDVIALGRDAKAKKIIKEFEEDGIKILNGPYGPYVTDGKKNARIPKERKEDAQTLTLEECQELIKKAKPSRRRRGQAMPPNKRPSQ
ncbi:MAG: type I DNA topoisomerase [Candidatus Magasanikbacteria bacterium CG10_big_fil_rev_8_21_14_0_10_47_10]|uniref:DNA topoisomerase 1 n=1 Tax=Candidatus Magasanikbacteria bacterium CG10_big_fil_rev_8_21_14_0_10_47_10 TaxID=1974652 RepID=A0A2H0TPG8_9BACT|nr:MAG: type I DNA topoisomerase [Candidatus Magasanikbacteria bacterium CG10_big_fil_rev_8_21_14_0_10_47_10]